MDIRTLSNSQSAAAAERLAAACWAANLRALATTQPRLVEQIQPLPAHVQPIFGRDGSLTAMHADGRWWNGCSLPRLAARAMLAEMELNCTVACLLAPTHAAQLSAALERLRADQAVVAVVPDRQQLRVMLQCEDLAGAIEAHRLWFAAGEDWAVELERIFEQHPGLPAPASFIRIKATIEHADALVPAAREVVERVNARRGRLVDQLRNRGPAPRSTKRLLVAAPANFRLWDDAGDVLWDAISHDAPDGFQPIRFNPDDPASAAPLALAQAASESDAIISANVGRADLPAVVRPDVPWIAWVTSPRVPPFCPQSPRDLLLLCDPAWKRLAADAGWPDAKVIVAGWPATDQYFAKPTTGGIGLIADTCDLEPPKKVRGFSSHELFWKLLRDEIATSPFAISPDPLGLLERRMRECGIEDAGFDKGLFLDRLTYPAYGQSIARLLLTARLPLRLYGKGWEAMEGLRDHCFGAIATRDQFRRAVSDCSVLIHPFPGRHIEMLRHLGRPAIGACRDERDLISQIQSAQRQPSVRRVTTRIPPISTALLLQMLHW